MNLKSTNGQCLAIVTTLPAGRDKDAVSAVTVRVHRSGHWTVVEVDGEMDIQAVALVADLVGDTITRVVFDLPHVTFIDATGLGLMLKLQNRALAAGGSVRLAAPSRSIRKLLMLTGCSRAFPTFDSLEDALYVQLDTEPEPVA